MWPPRRGGPAEGRRPGLQGDLSVCEACAVGISASSGHPLAALPCLRVLLHSSSLCPARQKASVFPPAPAAPVSRNRPPRPLALPLSLRLLPLKALAVGISASASRLSLTSFKLVSSLHACLCVPDPASLRMRPLRKCEHPKHSTG